MGPICVDREAHPESMTCGIQEAIDALSDYGGTVFIPAGRYVMRRAILPGANVTLRGEGYATVLTRPAPVISKLAESTRPNETTMRVEDASGFHRGGASGGIDHLRIQRCSSTSNRQITGS